MTCDTDLKLCRDCRWKRRQFLLPPACGNHLVSPVRLDPVTGKALQKRKWCSEARYGDSPCGSAACLWEPRG